MGGSAVVAGDRATSTCTTHLVPNPVGGAPQPAPPLPFSAPLLIGCCASVLIEGRPVVVVGTSGPAVPPHVGLHPADPYALPSMQLARVTTGSQGVRCGGAAAVRDADTAQCCGQPGGTVAGSATSVRIG